MASTKSKYNQTLFARRKTSDIQRLANQYQKESTGLTGEYETAFAGYQKNVAEQMLPYEEQMKQYKEVASPAYEAATERYNQEFENYKSALSAWEEKPYTETIRKSSGGSKAVYQTPIPMPTFNKKAPSAPAAPKAPEIGAFDEAPFKQRREELQTTYQRELAERKSARLGAARRESSRPMLQGA
jgi:hypothetical protein